MKVKIYTHDNIELTTLFQIDFEGLNYRKANQEAGTASFVVRVDNPKITGDTVRVYNRVKIYNDSGIVEFSGFTLTTTIELETIQITVAGILGILKVRTMPFNYTLSGDINTCLQTVIDHANSIEDTGIRSGQLLGTGSINRQFNGDDVFSAITDIVEGNACQFYFDHNTHEITVKPQVGVNRSNDIVFQYDTRNVLLSNLSSFRVVDNGDSVCTVASGRVDASNNEILDNDLVAKYGRIERNKAYRTISNTDLATQLYSELSESEYSPDLVLSPQITDSFDVGDIVGVRLYNKVVDIDTAYQILEKEIVFSGNERSIRIRVNKKQTDIIDVIKKHEKDIKSLSNHL